MSIQKSQQITKDSNSRNSAFLNTPFKVAGNIAFVNINGQPRDNFSITVRNSCRLPYNYLHLNWLTTQIRFNWNGISLLDCTCVKLVIWAFCQSKRRLTWPMHKEMDHMWSSIISIYSVNSNYVTIWFWPKWSLPTFKYDQCHTLYIYNIRYSLCAFLWFCWWPSSILSPMDIIILIMILMISRHFFSLFFFSKETPIHIDTAILSSLIYHLLLKSSSGESAVAARMVVKWLFSLQTLQKADPIGFHFRYPRILSYKFSEVWVCLIPAVHGSPIGYAQDLKNALALAKLHFIPTHIPDWTCVKSHG